MRHMMVDSLSSETEFFTQQTPCLTILTVVAAKKESTTRSEKTHTCTWPTAIATASSSRSVTIMATCECLNATMITQYRQPRSSC